ncbi:hypothetical protein P8452_34533 [Trifolium repens]|nr:hypothetical protein P8452_34533 [Trifolium repens]
MILFCFDQSSPLVKLTKATDKIVKFVKHIFYRHIVSHYNITNTVSRKLLVNVVVTACALDAIGFDEVLTKPLKSLPYDTPGVTYVAFKNPKGASLSKHVVIHYNITNTVSGKLLVNVVVTVAALDEVGFDEVLTKCLKSLPYDTPGVTYVAIKKF